MAPSVCACPRCPYSIRSPPNGHLAGGVEGLIRQRARGQAACRFASASRRKSPRPMYCFVFSCAMIFAPRLAERLVRAGLLGMPVGVEQHLHALAAGLPGDLLRADPRIAPQAAVDHRQTVRSGDDDDVAASAGELDEVVAERCGWDAGMSLFGDCGNSGAANSARGRAKAVDGSARPAAPPSRTPRKSRRFEAGIMGRVYCETGRCSMGFVSDAGESGEGRREWGVGRRE